MKYKFVIDRKTWLRGEDNSYLLRDEDGKMCCLGQISEQCGINKNKLFNKPLVQHIFCKREDFPEFLASLITFSKNGCSLASNSRTSAIMAANDNKAINDEEREKRLISLFAGLDAEVTFIN